MVPNPDYIDLGHIIKEPNYLTFFQISDIINISKERNRKMKEVLTATKTKSEFIQSIYNWLMLTLEKNGKEEYKNCFTIEGSSIMCNLPTNYFNMVDIPANTKIEMKFISKKN